MGWSLITLFFFSYKTRPKQGRWIGEASSHLHDSTERTPELGVILCHGVINHFTDAFSFTYCFQRILFIRGTLVFFYSSSGTGLMCLFFGMVLSTISPMCFHLNIVFGGYLS